MRLLLTALAVLGVALTLAQAGDDAAKKELKLLAGKWKLVDMEQGGQKVPADKLPAFSFELSADGACKVKEGEDGFEVTVSVNPGKKPKTMDIDHQTGREKGKKQYAIYKLEGNHFTVIATNPGGEAADRPKEFDSDKAKTPLLVFERVKDVKKR